jgi:hypothetical protein
MPPLQSVYEAEEAWWLAACKNTVWEPGFMDTVPDLVHAPAVADRVFNLFAQEAFPLKGKQAFIQALQDSQAQRLPVYEQDCIMRGNLSQMRGPEWRQQLHRAEHMLGLGEQRHGFLSKHAVSQLVQSGLTKEEHMAASAMLESPFDR